MIRINLLPEPSKKGAPARRPSGASAASSGGGGGFVIAVLGLLLFGTAGALGFYSYSSVGGARRAFENKEKERATVEADINRLSTEAKEIQRLMEVFKKQYEVLKALDPPDQILWSEKINMLAQLMPPDVFLNELEVTEQVVEVETQTSLRAQAEWEKNGKKGEKPEIVKKPVTTYTFKLTGLATGGDNREQFANVLKFQNALQSFETSDNHNRKRTFMQYFQPEISIDFIEATLYEKQYPVNQFVFVLKSLPQTSQETTEDTSKPSDTKAVGGAGASPGTEQTVASNSKDKSTNVANKSGK